VVISIFVANVCYETSCSIYKEIYKDKDTNPQMI